MVDYNKILREDEPLRRPTMPSAPPAPAPATGPVDYNRILREDVTSPPSAAEARVLRRGTILPLTTYEGQKWPSLDLTAGVPGMLYDYAKSVGRAAALPGRALQGDFSPNFSPLDRELGRRPPADPKYMGEVLNAAMALTPFPGAASRYKAIVPTSEQLINSSGKRYGKAERSPIEYFPDAMTEVTNRARSNMVDPNFPRPGAKIFTPEAAPEIYTTLDRFDRGFPYPGTRPVTPKDFETLRQQSRGLPGASGPAGSQVVRTIDQYMEKPPPFSVAKGTPAEIAQTSLDLARARGDWRAGQTAKTFDQAVADAALRGRDAGTAMRNFVASPAGRKRLVGATDAERKAIVDEVAANAPSHSVLPYFVIPPTTATLGGTLALAGFPVSGAVTAAAGWVPPMYRAAKRYMNERSAARAAEDISQQMRLNSPLGLEMNGRLSAGAGYANPNVRDLIARTTMQQLPEWQGTMQRTLPWEQESVPPASEDRAPLRITVSPWDRYEPENRI